MRRLDEIAKLAQIAKFIPKRMNKSKDFRIKVAHVHRKPSLGLHYSMESIFAGVRKNLPGYVVATRCECPHSSTGVFGRLRNMIYVNRLASIHDIIHVTGDVHYLAMASPRRRTLLTIHDTGSVITNTGLKGWLLKKLWYDFPIGCSSSVSVISSGSYRDLLAVKDCSKTRAARIIWNPVDKRFQPFEKAFNKKCPRVLQIGTRANKNLENLAAALEGMPHALRVIGPLTEDQRRLLNRYNVNYTSAIGLTDGEMVNEYKMADIVTVVSTYEGFGLPIVEAQACERVVVVSNLKTLAEVAGRGAWFVNPRDTQDIRAALKSLIVDETRRLQLIASGRENARRFSVEVAAEGYARWYQETMESGRAASPVNSTR